MKNPTVSVIMATHNRASLLPASVASILGQTFTDFELIIVDDASEDETPKVLAELENNDRRVRTIRLHTNVGPGVARNMGIECSRGSYIAILDDDDRACHSRLQRQVDMLESDPTVGLVFSTVTFVRSDGSEIDMYPRIVLDGQFPDHPKEVFTLLYLQGTIIPNTTIMYRRKLFDRYGGYPDYPWTGEDRFWFMVLAASGVRFVGLREPLVQVVRDEQHVSLIRQGPTQLFASRRLVLQMIRAWLRETNIQDFNSLHRKAWSNLLVREARYGSRWHGVELLSRALLSSPMNRYAWSSLSQLTKRGVRKLVSTLQV